MSLTPIKLRPGINRSSTDYSNEGGYFACDKVRFRAGKPEKIGGWVKYLSAPFVGTVRALFNWVTVDKTNLLAIATNVKYYLEASGGLYDITPLRTTVTLINNPMTATEGSNDILVEHANHGASNGDFVTFSDVIGFAGVGAIYLNKEFQLTFVSSNSYTVTVEIPAITSGVGGGTPTAQYQITTTPNVSVPGRGWGAGAWGRGAWGSMATVSTYTTLRLWSQESFGEDHVFCPRNGPVYYWDFTLGLTSRAISLTAKAGASDVPLMATKLLMSTQDRHLIAFGVNPVGSTVQDPLLIRWADTESVTMWTNLLTNAAGELRCSKGNYIVTAIALKQEILVFTDSAIQSMQYIGAPLIFGLTPTVDNISIISPNCAAVVGNAAYWMGNDKFYIYNGRVDTLQCTLEDYIFDDINKLQADQIFAGTNEGFNEIWWFYCSANSNTINRYVIYNHVERVWAYGTMERTAWLDTPLKKYPIAASSSAIYRHEEGSDDDRVTPIHAWIESSDFNLDTGEHFSFINRMLPDVSFTGSSTAEPALDITLTARNAPGGSHRDGTAKPVVRSVHLPVELYTEEIGVRLRGRQIKMRIESTGLGVQWKVGVPRIDIRPDGFK